MTLTRRARELVIVATLLAVPVLFLRANLATLGSPERRRPRHPAHLGAAAGGADGVWCAASATRGRSTSRSCTSRKTTRVSPTRTRKLRTELVAAKNARRARGRAREIARAARRRCSSTRSRRTSSPSRPRPSSASCACASTAAATRSSRAWRSSPRPASSGACSASSATAATCSLAADPKSSIDVVVARTGGRGVVKGIAGSDRYRTRIEYLERKDEAAEGDLVVTSGLGGFFPRDLPVGKIVQRRQARLRPLPGRRSAARRRLRQTARRARGGAARRAAAKSPAPERK